MNMKKILQIVSQIIFLALFTVLVITGKIQLWMAVFAAGVILSIFLGRLYCGWACPINTVMRAVSWIKRKLKIKSFKIPAFLKKARVRYAVLGLFIALFVFVMVSGKKLPVLPGLLVVGVFLTFFFPEALWHKYLCPYGTIFGLVSSKAKCSVNIDKDVCINCGVCKKVCPAEAVENKNGQYSINKKDCLACMECERKCSVKAINYNAKNK